MTWASPLCLLFHFGNKSFSSSKIVLSSSAFSKAIAHRNYRNHLSASYSSPHRIFLFFNSSHCFTTDARRQFQRQQQQQQANNNNNENENATTPSSNNTNIISISNNQKSTTTTTTNTTSTTTTTTRPRPPPGFWRDPNNQRQFFECIASQLDVNHLDDWYRVTTRQVKALGGGGCLKAHSNSLARALRSAYPEHPWDATKFSKVPNGCWSDLGLQRALFDRFARELGLRPGVPDDWYGVTVKQIHALGGGGLLRTHYGDSLMRALATIYPEHAWQPQRFGKVSNGYWRDPRTHRQLFDDLARELKIERIPDDWYRFVASASTALGINSDPRLRPVAKVLRRYYGESLLRALRAIYPEHAWQNWRFPRVRVDSRDNAAVVKHFLESVSGALGVRHLDDWYRVSVDQLVRFGEHGYRYIRRSGGLAAALKRAYPEHDWDMARFASKKSTATTTNNNNERGRILGKKASQRWLKLVISNLFPPL